MRQLIRVAASLVASLFLVAAAAAQPSWQPANGDKLYFDVFRDGSKFGRHVVSFSRDGDTLTVDTDVELKVAIGPLTVFHYIHDVSEAYSKGALVSLASKTKKDGKWRTLAAQAAEGGLSITAPAFKGLRAGLLIPSTHWNIAEMKQPAMFSTETGAMLPINVTDKGLERVTTGEGEIEARRFDVKSELNASFWYDAAGRWVKCAFTAQGSKVEYVLRELPS